MLPSRVPVERVAGRSEIDIVGQLDRKVALGHRDHAAIGAMDHRNRAAPVALARNAPVPEAIGDRPLAGARGFEPRAGGLISRRLQSIH